VRIHIATPERKGAKRGNRIGAERWGRLLGELGHRVTIGLGEPKGEADVLIALHARRSAAVVRAFSKEQPGRPIVVVLTGTDLYGDLPAGNEQAWDTIRAADRLVVLQTHALEVLPEGAAAKARVILQSAIAPGDPPAPRKRTFDICVVGHLRRVKDPLRAAMASRRLPEDSRIAVLQAGAALESRLAERAAAESERNPRYRWLGEVPHRRAKRLIQRSRALVVSSRAEGGAHVVSEALVAGTPVLASRMSGNIGMLGDDYPALFPVGDTDALADLMHRFEADAQFRGRLELWCRLLSLAYAPERERFALRALLDEVVPHPSVHAR
jgi:putative glycosyltransferase (TIGR04348 family)